MTVTHWHLRITLESSAKDRLRWLAERERRSASNYVRLLIERDQVETPTGIAYEVRTKA